MSCPLLSTSRGNGAPLYLKPSVPHPHPVSPDFSALKSLTLKNRGPTPHFQGDTRRPPLKVATRVHDLLQPEPPARTFSAPYWPRLFVLHHMTGNTSQSSFLLSPARLGKPHPLPWIRIPSVNRNQFVNRRDLCKSDPSLQTRTSTSPLSMSGIMSKAQFTLPRCPKLDRQHPQIIRSSLTDS